MSAVGMDSNVGQREASANPSNEKWPELPVDCLPAPPGNHTTGNPSAHATATTVTAQHASTSPVRIARTDTIQSGRPPSLSIQSVASSEYSTWSSDRDTTFDSRRSSIISSASSYGYPQQPTQYELAHPQPPTVEKPLLTRSRRDAKQLHAARLQRSGSTSLAITKNKDGGANSKSRRFQRSASNPADALAAKEPPHEQGLTRMAYAEQQRWITVQQKTFTKWLNTKIESRGQEVKDLVQDLSDGVSFAIPTHVCPQNHTYYESYNGIHKPHPLFPLSCRILMRYVSGSFLVEKHSSICMPAIAALLRGC